MITNISLPYKNGTGNILTCFFIKKNIVNSVFNVYSDKVYVKENVKYMIKNKTNVKANADHEKG